MSTDPLRLENIYASYGDFPAVNDVSLKAGPGSRISVIGTNGSGKTTLMHVIAGLITPSSGEVYIGGDDVTAEAPEKRVERGLALVPQGARCFGRMSVEDNLLSGSYIKRARSESRDSLEKVYTLFPALKDKRHQKAETLSGGERQMTAIGRALMSKPSLILFDELSLGLAPLVIRDIYQRLDRLAEEEKLTIVLVEQDTKRAMRMTDYTYIMLKGRIVLEGKPDELTDAEVKRAYFGTDTDL